MYTPENVDYSQADETRVKTAYSVTTDRHNVTTSRARATPNPRLRSSRSTVNLRSVDVSKTNPEARVVLEINLNQLQPQNPYVHLVKLPSKKRGAHRATSVLTRENSESDIYAGAASRKRQEEGVDSGHETYIYADVERGF